MSAEKQPSFKEILQVITAIALSDKRSRIKFLISTIVLAAILIWISWR